MWTALALLAAATLGPAQASGLTFSHVRSTQGVLGPKRTDERLLPGDSLVLSFDLEGVTADETGKVAYSMALEVSDPAGKVLFRQAPQNLEATASLGGNTIPAYARVDVGVEQPAGEYSVKVMVRDRKAGQAADLTRKFTVLPRDFGLVRLTTSTDPDGQVPAPVVGTGQVLWLQCGAVGFMRNKETRQPSVQFDVRVLDESGKPVLTSPASSTVNKDVPEKYVAVPISFPLSLNRAGKFTVELSANDKISGKTSKLSFPLNVQPSP
jgi:hypothetical protein